MQGNACTKKASIGAPCIGPYTARAARANNSRTMLVPSCCEITPEVSVSQAHAKEVERIWDSAFLHCRQTASIEVLPREKFQLLHTQNKRTLFLFTRCVLGSFRAEYARPMSLKQHLRQFMPVGRRCHRLPSTCIATLVDRQQYEK